jgi:hypothetical protein
MCDYGYPPEVGAHLSQPGRNPAAQPMIVFLVTRFKGHYPVGTSAIVYAHDREECKRVLRAKLREQGLGSDDPDHWTIEPLTPVLSTPSVRVVQTGDY